MQMLETLLKVGGVTALIVGVFFLLYREIIRRNIFVTITQTQTFVIFLVITILVWSVAITGILFRDGFFAIAVGRDISVNQGIGR
jgi:uncharacterized membrane protein